MAGQDRLPGGPSRRGVRRGPRAKRSFQPQLAGLAVGAVIALAGWAVLVVLAIRAGRSARGGDSGQWVWLAVESLGAVACLFGCLWLVTLLLRRLGILQPARRSSGPHRH